MTAVPGLDPTSSGAFILVNLARRMVLIGGTLYAGEIKKSIFTVMNYLMPKRGVMAMHCSANYGRDSNDVAIFFGLSGTGKTTLSNDAARTLSCLCIPQSMPICLRKRSRSTMLRNGW